MRAFALTCEALAHLDSVEGKVQCAAAYLISRPAGEVSLAARFLSGSPLPPGTRPPQVGGAGIAAVVAEQCGVPAQTVRRRAVTKGDLGTAVGALLEASAERSSEGVSLSDVAQQLADLGAHSATGRLRRLRSMFAAADPLEAKYLTKLLVGSLRTGMQSGRVEEAIALAFRHPLDAVRRAHMLLGDIGVVAERAHQDTLGGVRLHAFRPVRCMLAYPADDPADVLEHLALPVIAEHKLDGIRAQLHVGGGKCRLYSRSLEDITHLFPELGVAVDELHDDCILDGEIVAWLDGPLPFEHLQQRLGRRQVPLTMLLDIPVVYHAFDFLRCAGRDLIDESLATRKEILQRLPIDGAVRRVQHETIDAADAIADYLEKALDGGQEGVVIKDPESTYQPGTRGRAWVKLKRPIGTLDVVVTAAQYGRGRRAGWLSDLTFAVRGDDGTFVDVGKAYSGLTDAEIRKLTEHFKATTSKRSGDVHVVEPTVILEVAFGGIQRSKRHASGFALRFPRIERRRDDLRPADIDGVDRLEELFRAQKKR